MQFSTRLRMKIGLEKRVMNTMYLQQKIHRKSYFFFNEVHEYTEIPKSSLQRILPRLVKRRWIRKFNVPILDKKDWIKNLTRRKKIERPAYKVIEYPYLEWGGFIKNDNNKMPPLNVPEGTKRFWKRSSKEVRKLQNEFPAKRIDLWKRVQARRFPHKYNFR